MGRERRPYQEVQGKWHGHKRSSNSLIPHSRLGEVGKHFAAQMRRASPVWGVGRLPHLQTCRTNPALLGQHAAVKPSL